MPLFLLSLPTPPSASGHERRQSPEAKTSGSEKKYLRAMQANRSQLHSPPGTGSSEDASAPQCVHTRLTGEGSCLHSGDVHIQINSIPKECAENTGSRNTRSGVHSCAHGCVHSRLRGHSHSEARLPDDTAAESGDHGSSSFSEFRYLFKWLQKSLPYILILSVKLVMQHITGISLGIGLLTTFMYANKSIVNQVFLRERSSKIQCAWLLVFLAGSSVLLYYTFHSQSLYYSLIFLNPTLDHLSFWEVLWIVGITDFILKFFFMGLKCLILLVPSFIMPFKSKGYWYMLLEELCQYYRTFVPIPVWFRYLISYGEFANVTRWSLGILLALLYLVLKSYGVAASKRQCSDVDDICSICQAEFQKPVLLICQHIFCEECITLWFNREKTCPLCRTVISDHINKWKDGATSSHLQIY
ncbi:E3 ubiquitin-protein ligase RNFT1 isoform X3 [Papio anubis]|uniref:E3 ubiquitin-protein ligase RNFT1 n=1 Tax=Cercocebus atys TaxID=9531 RepID=A0A2K5MZ39_CERAT|nr:PREDICTED: RING finger and transmembrane domain-containing protein 1 isoform X2 [Cercocebus atys]XP_031513369.1 E3 ubiquitin-protein ligase RNFT1 isoform X3 [Papio anubis]